tara:strand:+ start:211 stop:399 length:189 start_codon:yes stop_codon:yes gene_type:complete
MIDQKTLNLIIEEYFNSLSADLKTKLDEQIDKMSLKDWLDPLVPAPWDDDYCETTNQEESEQ